MSGMAELTQWLHRRTARGAALLPEPGVSRTILISGPEGAAPPAMSALAMALAAQGQGRPLRLLVRDRDAAAAARAVAQRRAEGVVVEHLDLARAPAETAAARGLLAACRPAAVVHVGDTAPTALLAAAHDAGINTAILAPRLNYGASWWNAGTLRRALGRVTRLFLTDPGAGAEAIRHGIEPQRIELVPALDPVPEPLRHNARELATLHGQLQGRHAWLAAALPLDEADAVIAAHQAVLAYNHRAILLIAPMDPAAAERIAARAEAAGLTVARRALDDEPTAEFQIYMADDLGELGLWYRLASVSFMGGTLIGPARIQSRNPFEPASLGSAILHGPQIAAHGREWRQLDAARAAWRVASPEALAQLAADLAAPDLAAGLALQAWTVATGGAAAAGQVARMILDDLADASEPSPGRALPSAQPGGLAP